MGGTFHGATVITLDAKGRFALPTRHRDTLAAGDTSADLVLTAHPDGCILLYPMAEWEPVRGNVEKFPAFHPQSSWWKRLLLGYEEHVCPDAAGRILISPALRMHAKLERELTMVGQGRYFELWDQGQWTAGRTQALGQGGHGRRDYRCRSRAQARRRGACQARRLPKILDTNTVSG